MLRYVSKSVRWSSALEDDAMDASVTVVEREDGPQDTGLLDQRGNRIYRVADPKVYGFR